MDKEFLDGDVQAVALQWPASKGRSVTSTAVPQGSVLGAMPLNTFIYHTASALRALTAGLQMTPS